MTPAGTSIDVQNKWEENTHKNTRSLEKLGTDDQKWLERNLSALLLKMLVVCRRQPSESIEAALDME